MDWDLFDGFDRVEKVKRRLAEEEAARAELEIQRLDTILDVWSSYVSLNQWLTHLPPALVQAHLNIDLATIHAIPHPEEVIVPAEFGEYFKLGATRPSSQSPSPVRFAFPDTNEQRSPGVGH